MAGRLGDGCDHLRPRRPVCRRGPRRLGGLRRRRGTVLQASFALPEFGPNATFPGAIAINFHFIDYVVHGWDVAESLGVAYALPDDVVDAALPLALVVPDGDYREMPDSPFARAVNGPAAPGATKLDRILRHLGRSPDWAGLRTVDCKLEGTSP